MGSAVSVGQQNQIPDVLDRKVFQQLTGSSYNQEAYDCFVDDDGLISKNRFIEVVSSADVYISHDWGLDGLARSTHDRALKIGNYLSRKGLFVSVNNGPEINEEVGNRSSSQIAEKMSKAQCVIICITSRYCQQLASTVNSVVREEFYTALSVKGPLFMLPILMEEDAKLSSATTIEVVYDLFKGKYCVDCSNYDKKFVVKYGLKKVKILENIVLDDVYDCILKTIKPLRDGGSYTKQQFIRDNTVPGRHYTWLKKHLPQFDHTKCARYSSLITEAGVTTSSKLFHLVQCDDKYLLKLGVSTADAALIYKKLHDDLIGNMNPVAAVKIDAIIAVCDAKEQRRLDLILTEKARTDSIAVMHQENVKMGVEDEFSHELREEWRRAAIRSDFGAARMRLWEESMSQTMELNDRIFTAQKVMFQQFCRNTDSQRTQEYIRISKITSGVVACAAVRHLLLRVQREVIQSSNGGTDSDSRVKRASMMGRTAYKDRVDVVEYVSTKINDTRSSSTDMNQYLLDTFTKAATAIADVSSGDLVEVGRIPSSKLLLSKQLEVVNGSDCDHVNSQQKRVSEFVQPGFLDRDDITADSAGVDSSVGDYNGNAVYNYLQEGVILLHLITVLARDNPSSRDNITAMVENSVVKLWTPLMTLIYHFDYTFDSAALLGSAVDPSYHRLSAPLEGLLALKFLMRYNPYRSSVNLRIVYLFGAANTIELCLEIVKVHFNNRDVVLHSLECILIMMDNVEYYREYAARVVSLRDNLMMLLMLLNQYSLEDKSEDRIVVSDKAYCLQVNVVILNILGLVVRTNQFNALLLKFHCNSVVGIALNQCIVEILRLLEDPSNRRLDGTLSFEKTEICIRLLNALDCIYLDHAHVVSFNSTTDNRHATNNVGLLATQRLPPHLVVGVLSEILQYSLCHDNSLAQYVAFTIGNVTFDRLEYKELCARNSVVAPLAEVLKKNMKDFNDGINAVEACETVLSVLISLSNILLWQHNAVNVVQFNNEMYARKGESKNNNDRRDDVDASQLNVRAVIENGVCEVVMNIFREYGDHRSLVRAALLVSCKLCYKGQYEACHRLVSLGLCEYILRIYNLYKGDTSMYFLLVILLHGLADSHPNLVGAAKRLVSTGICGMVTEGLRLNCKVTGNRKWSHFSYPFTCRICLQTCQCVVGFSAEKAGADALKKFTKCGFQGILLKAPDLVNDDLDIEEFLALPKSSAYEDEVQDGEECAPRLLKTALDLQMLEVFEAGKFNGNIEYLANPDSKAKGKVMNTLFNLFHIE